jgi:penicillin-binding protein 1A
VRRLFGAVLGVALLLGIVGGAGGWMAWQHFSTGLPDVDGLRNYQPPVMSRVFAGDGRLLAELATERRIFVPISAIPPIVRQAFVSAEDQNFYTHPGVDPLAMARAAVFDLTHLNEGRRPIGASTITQQVAKNMLLDNQITLARKAKEVILAIRIEQTLPKDRILELYLNEIYLGMGSYGVAAAAQAYFNKSLDQLTIAEAAFLAALPKAPNNLNPFKYPDAARARRDYALDRMADDHAITAAQAATAKAQPVVPSEFRRPPPIPGADWFAEEVRRELIAQFGQDVNTQGLTVRTSLDPALQAVAEKTLRDGLMAYDRSKAGWRGPVTHLDPGGSAPERDWAAPLSQVARPPGMLSNWRLAVVLSESDSEAKVGWIEPTGGQGESKGTAIGDPQADAQGRDPQSSGPQSSGPQSNGPQGNGSQSNGSQGNGLITGQPRIGALTLADVSWARQVHDGKPGPVPRHIAEVLQPGDVVMVEPGAPTPAAALPPRPIKGKPALPRVVPLPRLALRQIPLVQGALVTIDPATGRVLAMVGGWSFEQSQFNRVTQAKRQPGSSFKPFVYLTALEKGVSPSQRYLDAPLVLDTPEGRWRPGNYEGTFGGPTSLHVALEQSLNLVTLHVAQQVGMEAVAETATRFHMVDSMPQVLPAALGAVETTVLREAGAYASLATGGREVTPSLIDSVQDRDGQVVSRIPGLSCEACADPDKPPEVSDTRPQIADPASVYQLTLMMEDVVQHGTGMPAGKGLNRPIAGKTGTSQDFVDAWFTGFTPDLLTSVWLGYDNPASLGNNETGGNVAGPIWHDYMAAALKDRPVLNFPQPPGLTVSSWDSGSGMATDAFKPDQIPGASAPLGLGLSDLQASGTPADQPNAPGSVHGGVDTSMGGLY